LTYVDAKLREFYSTTVFTRFSTNHGHRDIPNHDRLVNVGSDVSLLLVMS